MSKIWEILENNRIVETDIAGIGRGSQVRCPPERV
jgi:hypothetical protein